MIIKRDRATGKKTRVSEKETRRILKRYFYDVDFKIRQIRAGSHVFTPLYEFYEEDR